MQKLHIRVKFYWTRSIRYMSCSVSTRSNLMMERC